MPNKKKDQKARDYWETGFTEASDNNISRTQQNAPYSKREDEGKKQTGQVMSKSRIIKNLLVICAGFLLLFCAFQALANLQSTINSVEGLGVASQSVIYACLIISSMFLPTYLIKKLGCKWTLTLAILTYSPYIAANFYPHWGTLMPAAVILGLGAAPLWSAKCTYLNEIGFRYTSHVSDSVDTIIVRFFGIFFMFFQSSQIWGNLISYFILRQENNANTTEPICGASFCPYSSTNSSGNNTNLDPPSDEKRYLLIGIYLGCSVAAALLVGILLDPLERENGDDDETISPRLLVATFKHMVNLKQIILIPLTVYSGIEQAFFLSEYTKAYVGCALGVHYIGFIAICFGVVNAIVSLISGPLVKYITRVPFFLFAAAANVGCCIGLLLWYPTSDKILPFFLFAGVWGFGDAVWQTQINALYGVLFKSNEEAAFSNYRLWESIGFSIAFAYSNFLCTDVKLYIVLSILGVGMVGYLTIEVMLKQSKSASYSFDR